MISLKVILEGDGCWPDLGPEVPEAVQLSVAGLEKGMESGKPSVTFRLDLMDGGIVTAQTSLVLFLAAADALKARFGDPR